MRAIAVERVGVPSARFYQRVAVGAVAVTDADRHDPMLVGLTLVKGRGRGVSAAPAGRAARGQLLRQQEAEQLPMSARDHRPDRALDSTSANASAAIAGS